MNLDAISVASVPDGPFGQDLRYGAAVRRVNAFIHELRPAALPPSTSSGPLWTNGGKRASHAPAAAVDRLERVVDPEQDHDELDDHAPPQIADHDHEEPADDAAGRLRRQDREQPCQRDQDGPDRVDDRDE